MNSGQSKKELRAKVLAERRTLSAEEYATRSGKVLSQLETVPEFTQAPLVLTYVASKDREVDTRPLLGLLAKQGRSISAPRSLGGGAMEWRRIGQLSELAVGRFGILEPPESAPLVESFPGGTVVLVPGIAFTRRGDRIGYGGGYFDRFLKAFAGASIGLAFDFQVVERLEVEPHDVPVAVVVTEGGVYRGEAQASVNPAT